MASAKIRPMNSHGPMYSPSRDVAYFGPALLKKVGNYINKEFWPTLHRNAAILMGTTDLDEAWNAIIDCHDAYYRYMAECCRDPKESPADVLKRVGWSDLPEGARTCYLAVVGLIYSTKLYAALRDEHHQGDEVDVLEVATRAFPYLIADLRGSTTSEEGLRVLRRQVRECRSQGTSFDEILAAVNIEKLGG